MRVDCYLIGGTRVLVSCAEALLSHGVGIRGILSEDAAVRRWARERDIEIMDPRGDLVQTLSGRPFDFLFSVVNFRVLSAEVLALPRVAALNFHDGPLPGFAGSNIASWALYEGVRRHAASWHLMTEEVDAGAVVAERYFPVRDLSTALSLTYETAQVGIDLFTEMAPLLAQGRVPEPVAVDDAVPRRHFARADRMAGGGIVHAGTTAAEAGRLSKAMDFGSFPNPVGVPAFVTDQDAVFVGQIRTLDRDEEYLRPTTLSVTDSQIRIAAADADMILSDFTSTEGDALSGRGAAQRLGLRAGEPVPVPAEGFLAEVERAQPELRGHEHRWRERLADVRTLPLDSTDFSAQASHYNRFELAFLPTCEEDRARVREAFLAILAERAGVTAFDFGWSPRQAQELAERTHGLTTTRVPIRFDADEPDRTEQELARARHWNLYATDLEVRLGLAARPPGADGPSYTRVMVLERFREDPAAVASDTEIALVLPPEGVPAVFARETAMSADTALDFVELVEERLFAEPDQERGGTGESAPTVDNGVSTGDPETVVDLVARVWERNPDAVAVRTADGVITYAELETWSATVRDELVERGVGPGSVVALLTGRGPELVPSMLGVARTGAAFLPLDPGYPRERLRTYAQIAGATLVLTTAGLEGNAHFVGTPVLVPEPARRPAQGREAAEPRSLAYVLFTSGSTGTPKGVEVGHAALANFLEGVGQVLDLAPGARVLAHTTVAFDISLLELLLPLVRGATVELADEETVASPEALTDLADAMDLVQATPSLWRLLLDTGWRPRPGLVALSGGEALPEAVAEALYEAGAELWNMYGPTEATIWVSAQRVREPRRGFVPLGDPLPGLELHVLDQDLTRTPPGGTGALYITGAGLAEGYRSRPDLTSAVFVALPDGRRAYRTGDDVRLHPDGAIEWIGRADAQVKVRGNRIEPGEIEAHLERLNGVSAAVVAAVPFEGRGEPRLTAYLVTTAPPARADLDEWLTDRLPAYMVPDAYVPLDALPLTENGKVARGRLPVPTRDTVIRDGVPAVPPEKADREEPAGVPTVTTAERIAAVFAEVLGHAEFGTKDNYFDLGGDSANVVRAAAAVGEELGVDVRSPLIFATGTPERLASAVGTAAIAPQTVTTTESETAKTVAVPADAEVTATPEVPKVTPSPEPFPTDSVDPSPAAEEALAVIGMACRFPGAATPDDFWADLARGVDRVVPAPHDHRGWGHLWERTEGHRAGWIEGVEDFAPERFGLGDREARRLDPLQRLMLSVTDEALESGGYDGFSLGAATGVFVGTIASDFPEILAGSAGHEDPHAATGTAMSMVANRLSYTFGWSGPSLAVDTACSSSLVALDQARTHLRAGVIDAAVVGGVNVILTPDKSLAFRRNGMLSPTGACHTFDDGADGYVRGEGCGVVVLKRLADARRDGDPVLAVVNGTAVNHTGNHSGFLTAPSTTAQQDVIRRAMADAGVSRVGYVEAHGTGTSLGDIIELESLRSALADHPRGSVAVGSVKNAIGHLEPAAGIAGLIKTVLALQARRTPPMSHLSVPNRGFAFEDSPLYVSARLDEWRGPSAAGVSSFGFGGVNAHAVLTAPPEEETGTEDVGPHLMVMSADSRSSLRVLAGRYLRMLDSPHRPPLAAMCATARSRRGLSHRLACVVSGSEQLEDKLRLFLAGVEDTRSLHTGQVQEVGGARERVAVSGSREELDRSARMFVRGHDLMGESGHVRVRLPSTPHEERRLWLEPANAPGSPSTNGMTWSHLPEAAGHVVRGRPVLPAAGYPFRAAELLGRDAFRLTDVVFRAPAIDPVALRGTREGDRILFRDGADGLLCEARVATEQHPSLREGSSEGARPVDVAAMYEELAEAGLEYGIGYRCVRSVSTLPGEAFGVLEGGASKGSVDPHLLDGAFQVGLLACGARGLYVPFSVRSLSVLGSLQGSARVYARRERVAAGGEMVTASLVVSDDSGPVVEVGEMTWKRLSAAPPVEASEKDPSTGVPSPAPGVRPEPSTTVPSVNGHGPTTKGTGTSGGHAGGDLSSAVIGWVAAALEMDVEEIDPEAPLQQLGMDSMLSVSMAQDIGDRLDVGLPPTLLLETGTVTALVAELRERYGVASAPGAVVPEPAAPAEPDTVPPVRPPVPSAGASTAEEPVADPADDLHDIAVIGIDGVFPGASDMDGLWRVLAGSEDHVREVPADRWNLEEYYSTDQEPGSVYLREAGFVREWDEFDPAFFRIPPSDARWMDPQQRHLIQSVWRTLEDAGQAGARRDLTVGVFVGASYQHYRDQVVGDVVPTAAALGNHNAILANRVSHFLDLRGPSMTIDTLCSSSLVALHQAVRSIRGGECDQAVVAGVHMGLSPQYFQLGSRLRSFSPTGRSRAFDAGADGFVPGEGVVTLLVKPLGRALREGDRVHAVIRGTAVNHGGRSSGLTVPNGSAQRGVVVEALRDAGVDAGTVTMVEAHGTGTPLGDPIEVEALTEAFRAHTGRRQFCAIGSVKSNIGHLEPAAGLAGLAKVVLAMRHRVIPATLHLERPNARIDFAGSPFYAVAEAVAWEPPVGVPRRAGVSAFGMGGVNAHVVLEEPPAPPDRTSDLPSEYPLRISGATEEAVRGLAAAYAERIAACRNPRELADVCHTVNTGRAELGFQTAVLGSDADSLARALRAVADGTAPIPATGGPVEGDCLDASTAVELARRGHTGIPWADFSAREARVADDLPPYPFAERSFWSTRGADAAEKRTREPEGANGAASTTPPRATRPRWRAETLPAPTRAVSGTAAVVGSGHTIRTLGGELSAAGFTVLPSPGEHDLDALIVVDPGPEDFWSALRSWTSALPRGGRLVWVGNRTAAVTTEERAALAPAAAARAAAVLAAAAEYHLFATALDLVPDTDAGTEARAIVTELSAMPERRTAVALRGGLRYVRQWQEIDDVEPAPDLSGEGFVLVTGGAGAVGRLLIGRLAELGAARVGVVGRSRLDTAAVAELAALVPSTELAYLPCDVTDGSAVRAAVRDLSRRWGPLTGVVHASGRALPFGSHRNRAEEDAAGVLGPKIAGSDHVLAVAGEHGARFVVFVSSVAGEDPAAGRGLVDYAMANAYQLALAERVQGQVSPLTVTAHAWPDWSGVGLEADASFSATASLRVSEALAGFSAHLLSGGRVSFPGGRTETPTDPAPKVRRHPRPEPSTRPSIRQAGRPAEKTVTLVRSCLTELLGEDPGTRVVADLGLDSLAIADLVSLLERRHGTTVDPSAVMRARTVADIAVLLEAETGAVSPPEKETAVEQSGTEPVGLSALLRPLAGK